MANKVLHKKSNSVVGGVPAMPQPSQLEYGEIAINYNDGNEAIAIKNDANEIVSFPTYEQVQNLRCFIEGSVPSAIVSSNGNNTASSQYSFAVGLANAATGNSSFAEGNLTKAIGDVSHAEGQETTASTAFSHAEGHGTRTSNQAEHAQGRYNVTHSGSSVSAQTIHSVGIGTSSSNTMNAFEIMGDGGIYVYGVGEYLGSSIASADTLQRYLEKNEFVVASALNELNDGLSGLSGEVEDLGSDIDGLSQSVATLTSQTSTYELKSNKVTTMSSASTDEQYPSAKLVYDTIADTEYVVAQAINNLNDRISNPDVATTSQLGVMQVGSFLSVSNGVVSVATGTSSTTVARGNHNHGTASTSSYGVMKVGSYLSVTNGVVSVNVGNDSTTVAVGNHTHTPAQVGAAAASHSHEVGDLPVQTKLTSVDTEIPTGKAVIDYVSELVVSPVNYKGARTTGTLPASGDTKVGDLYIVQTTPISLTAAQSATGAAQTAETGDYIIARTSGTWDVVQKNLNGAVTSTANLTSDKFVLGNGSQTIKQSTYGPEDFALTGHTHDVSEIDGAESTDNKVTELSSACTDTQYLSAKAVYDAFVDNEFVVATSLNDLNDRKENITNKVTTINSNATNTEYPSALAVYNYVQSQGGGGSGTDPNALTGITVNGTLATVTDKVAAVVLPTAATNAYGMVQVGSFLSATNGVITVSTGTTSATVARGDHSHNLDNISDGSTRKLSDYSLTGHTHDYLPLTGGNVNNHVKVRQNSGTTAQYNYVDVEYESIVFNSGSTGNQKVAIYPYWKDVIDNGYQLYLPNKTGTLAITDDIPAGLPSVTASDNGKILRVVNGAWALVDPVTVYTGASAPSSSLGEDGDIYLQTD